jgi:hypothetical protein
MFFGLEGYAKENGTEEHQGRTRALFNCIVEGRLRGGQLEDTIKLQSLQIMLKINLYLSSLIS